MALVFPTPAALRTRLQDPDLDEAAAQQAINDAVTLIKAIARQDLDFVPNDTVTLAGGRRQLVLPQRPVLVDDTHPLTVVELIDGTSTGGIPAVEGVAFRRSGNRLIRLGRTREGVRTTSRHGVPTVHPVGVWAPWVKVTYSHGYQTLPDVLGTVILDAAAVYASNPAGLRSVALDGEVTITYATEALSAPRTLVDDLQRRLTKLRIRTGGAFSIATS